MAIFDYTVEKPIDERYLLCLYIYIGTTRSNVPRLNIHGKALPRKENFTKKGNPFQM